MSQNPEQPYVRPTYGAPYGAMSAPPQEDPGKTLGIIGLVMCFVVSLAGLIISIIAKKKSEEAGFMDNTPAKIGVILGWIFTILGFLGLVGYVIFIVVLVGSSSTNL
ncbi:DUF4190 domain-containing protein [Arthrobacter psychrolactophilus]